MELKGVVFAGLLVLSFAADALATSYYGSSYYGSSPSPPTQNTTSPAPAPAPKSPSPAPAPAPGHHKPKSPSPAPAHHEKPKSPSPAPAPHKPKSPSPAPAPHKPSPAPAPYKPTPTPAPAPQKPSPAPAPYKPTPAPAPQKPSPTPAPYKPTPAPAPAPQKPSPAPAPYKPTPGPQKPVYENPKQKGKKNRPMPLPGLGVEGLIKCRNGTKDIPIEGAVARITCLAINALGFETAPFSCLSRPTDKKGYFFASFNHQKLDDVLKIIECKAFLETSPLKTCKVPTDINNGISGFPLTSFKNLSHKNIKLYSVRPLFYTTEPPKSVPSAPMGY